ncbi:sugar ABC transporter permease [Streptomyces aidingensis]|uniref:Xylose transport system permease protein XylH n=1 Tax=Streptomyces aidingensis TaxID=910347 RepID=A0A1I1UK13_9ACTN|nr:ABC transporter permease [Streptomyces aidingensis]SFD69083.1 simple sugar transport system permease protein/D-xylose transport system permease protein [Streptomyces aidingensis]
MTPVPAPPSSRAPYPAASAFDSDAPFARLPRLLRRLPDRELGMLPIIGALVLIWAVFGIINPAFLSAENLVNLTLQSAPTGVIALGVVLVLLAGQIDLSVGSVSGLAASVVAVTTVLWEWPIGLGIVLALSVGVVVGLTYGLLATRLGLPSFVLTLAGLMVLAGVQLRVLGSRGSINLPFESWLVDFAQQGFLSPAAAWSLVAAVIAVVAAVQLLERSRRARAELPRASLARVLLRVGGLAALLGGTVAYLGTARGIGYPVVLFLSLVAIVDVLLRRTRWGRSVRAVGGDRRSAMLAGVAVRRVTVSCFVACSTFAALGGVLAAGRLAAANQGTGGAETYLTAIAAAVIGGTSLFGGRGSAWSALTGVLVITSISSGLTLLNLDTASRYIVTGLVLVLALTADTLLRAPRSR